MGAVEAGGDSVTLCWPDRVAVPWTGVAVQICAWIVTGSWLAALLLLPLPLLLAWLDSRLPSPIAWRLDDEGLHEHWRFGRRRTHPWETLLAVSLERDGYLLETTRGPVPIAYPRAARALMARLNRDAAVPPSGETVSPAQIADWLGIEDDGSLVTGMTDDWRSGVAALPLLAGLIIARGFASLFALAAVAAGVLLSWLVYRLAEPVRITPYGFFRRGRRVLSWDDITEPIGRYDGALAAAGKAIPLSDTINSRVADCVERILAAKSTGARLATDGNVPDTGLSLAEPNAEAAERGLSVVDGE